MMNKESYFVKGHDQTQSIFNKWNNISLISFLLALKRSFRQFHQWESIQRDKVFLRWSFQYSSFVFFSFFLRRSVRHLIFQVNSTWWLSSSMICQLFVLFFIWDIHLQNWTNPCEPNPCRAGTCELISKLSFSCHCIPVRFENHC